MSRSAQEQRDLENLIEQRDQLAIDAVRSGGDYETMRKLVSVIGKLYDYGIIDSPRAAVKANQESSLNAAVIRYDVRDHGLYARVVELRSGRRGVVEAIRETTPEYIEPIVRWSDGELSRAKYGLILESSLGGES